ncbi:hypothetical protein ACLKA6_008933 [Drosophila palustris]
MRFAVIVALVLAIWLCCLTSSSSADCCKPSKILFKLAENGNNTNCGTYGGKYHGHETCEKKVCGNGDGIVGTWCGRGRCNPRGCHCKNGCLPGDAVTSFRQKHGYNNFVYVGYA